MAVGAGSRQYEVDESWPRMPEEAELGQVVEIVVDSQDRVFVFHRGTPSPLIFDKGGAYLGTWEPNDHWLDIHGVCIGEDAEGEYFIVTDRDRHLVSRTTLDGHVVWSIGNKGVAGDQEPFNRPTDACVAPNGDIYVSDGYGNARVHQFTSSGKHIRSWGSPGIGSEAFNLPHAVRVIERGGEPTLYVCDRENHRIKLYTLDGDYIGKLTGFKQPGNIIVDDDGVRYVAELQARVAILDEHDNEITRIGGEAKREPGFFLAPHTVWTDSEGSLYVGEVLEGQRVQKFVRIEGD